LLIDVKPWETETDLDALFLKIKAITMEGLVWKEEYKKDPIAYGINKLVVGCVIEDAKVSSDDLVEKIEGFEEDVQSVDIAIFSKI
jgi:translation elongation factor EF-1beta